MLKIRLQRIGKKNSPSYRIVLVEHTSSSKSGRYIELLGSYDPKLKQRNFKKDRIQYWLSKGVQLSPTIHNLLVDEKIIDKAKIKAWKPKKKIADLSVEANKAQAEAPTNVGTKAESLKVAPTPADLSFEANKAQAEASTEQSKIEESKLDTETKKE